MGGAGRITELLLREFIADPPPGTWKLWGRPDRIQGLAFTGSLVAAATNDPRRLWGQRDIASVPAGDIVLYLHQIRPFRRGRSVTFIFDTIPLRHGGRPTLRRLKSFFFKISARLSDRVITISELSRVSIIRDLSLAPAEVHVVKLPVDEQRVSRVVAMRRALQMEDVLLYIGRFDRHKNLRRLVSAFAGSSFAAAGGRLELVGGWHGEAEELAGWVAAQGVDRVRVRPVCTEGELDRLLATSRALVCPSLEEGYGLPAFEAAATGLPVAVSRTGAMAELPDDVATKLDPYSMGDICRAIDEVTTRRIGPPGIMVDGNLRGVVLASLAACFAGGPTVRASSSSGHAA